MARVLVTPLAIPVQRVAISGISRVEENEEVLLLPLLHQPQALLNTNTSPISHQGGCPAASKPREVTRLTAWSRLPCEIVQAFQGQTVPQLCTLARFIMLIRSVHVQPTHTEHTYTHMHAYTYTCTHRHACTYVHTKMTQAHTCAHVQAHNLLVFIANHFRSELQASWLLYILVPQHFLTL